MSRPMNVAVVGATGQVGGVMRAILAERDFQVASMRYFSSARSAGTTLDWRGQELLGSTLPLAARALIRDGTPIDPYRRSEP